MDSLPPDPYVALDVPKDATAAAIKQQYRKLVLKTHPDKVEGEAQKEAARDEFYKIQTAYEIIGDEDRRQRYDAQCRLEQLRRDAMEYTKKRSEPDIRTSTFGTPAESVRGEEFYSRNSKPSRLVSPPPRSYQTRDSDRYEPNGGGALGNYHARMEQLKMTSNRELLTSRISPSRNLDNKEPGKTRAISPSRGNLEHLQRDSKPPVTIKRGSETPLPTRELRKPTTRESDLAVGEGSEGIPQNVKMPAQSIEVKSKRPQETEHMVRGRKRTETGLPSDLTRKSLQSSLFLKCDLEIRPERLLSFARDSIWADFLFIRSTRPLREAQDYEYAEIIFHGRLFRKGNADIFSETYNPDAEDKPTPSSWMLWRDFRERFPPSMKPKVQWEGLDAAESWACEKMNGTSDQACDGKPTHNSAWARFNQNTGAFKELLDYKTKYSRYAKECIDLLVDEKVTMPTVEGLKKEIAEIYKEIAKLTKGTAPGIAQDDAEIDECFGNISEETLEIFPALQNAPPAFDHVLLTSIETPKDLFNVDGENLGKKPLVNHSDFERVRRLRRGRGQRRNDASWADYNETNADNPFKGRECLFADAAGRLKTPAVANLDTGLEIHGHGGGSMMSTRCAKMLGREKDISRNFNDPCLQSITGHLTPITGILRGVVFRLKGTSVTLKRDFFICDVMDDVVDIMFDASFIKEHFKLLFERVKGCFGFFATWFSSKKAKKESAADVLERQRRECEQNIKATERELARLQKEADKLLALQSQSVQGVGTRQ